MTIMDNNNTHAALIKAGIVVLIIIDQVEEKEDLPKNQIAIQIVIILMMVQ